MRLAAAFIPLVLLVSAASARPIDPAERREVPFDAALPACEDPLVLHKIADQFATREFRFWATGLRIVGYERVQPLAWRPWGLDFIPRRFCSGTVLVSDGHRRPIYYSVRDDLGTIGLKWGVAWCIVGLDPHYSEAPNCEMARP